MSYWDTSALAKLYLAEPDSARFESMALASEIVIGAIGRYELRTVFRRREAEAMIPAGKAAVLYQRMISDAANGMLRVVADSEDIDRRYGTIVETCFSQTPPLFIRTNDALHLAAAHTAGETEFVTADQRQRGAAELLGFRVLP